MGLFSGSKTIVVSSTVYNMAGDEEARPNFMKNSLFGAIMSPYQPYIGETLVRNLFAGPGLYQRNFFNWCKRNEYPGLPTYSVTQERRIDPAIVAPFITVPVSPAGLVAIVQDAFIVSGDYSHIVEAYVLENFPANYDTAYISQYNKSTNQITIQWFGGGSVMFDAGSYSPDKYYIIATYYTVLPSEVMGLVTGSTTDVLTQPDLTGYSLVSSVDDSETCFDLDQHVLEEHYWTGDPVLPDPFDVNFDQTVNECGTGVVEEWNKTVYDGGDGNTETVASTEHWLYFHKTYEVYQGQTISNFQQNNDPVPGQTRRIRTTVTLDHLRPTWSTRTDTQETVLNAVNDTATVWSYEVGTGEATLDALRAIVSVSAEDSEYFPYLPVRLDNTSITDAIYGPDPGSDLYDFTNRAYRRAVGGLGKLGAPRFSSLVDDVEDNDSLEDIDYAFIHYGVALNVLEPACRAYMYEWFRGLESIQNTDGSFLAAFQTHVATYLSAVSAMNAWIYAQGDSARNGYGDAPPTQPKLKMPETTTVRLACADPQLENLDMRITWISVEELTDISGIAPGNLNKGDIELVWENEDFTWDVTTGSYPNVSTKTYNLEKVRIYWQTDRVVSGDASDKYKKITIWGLVHNNFVYGGEAVTTTAREAIEATTDDGTGFIVPLHYLTLKELGLVDSTQTALANTFIIFNSYEVVQQKWYQSFIVMLIIIIIIIVLVIVVPPLAGFGGAATGGGSGILGANAAIGAAMGLTGTAAIVAGAIVNAIVAIAVSQIVSYGSKALFGDKWGAVIAAVINLAITLGTSGVTFENLSELGTASNILKITSAVANGYNGYVQGAVAEMGDDLQDRAEEYEDRSKEIEKLLKDLRGTSGLNFDPLSLTDSVKGNDASDTTGQYIVETLDQFIGRTTMTGSDIVEITLAMVNNYAGLSLELPS